MKIKILVATNDQEDWAVAGHSRLKENLNQLALVVSSNMPGKITYKVYEVDLETLTGEEYKND